MNRKEIIEEIKKYFKISELVCDHTAAKFGDKAWRFLDTEYLHALLILRRDVIRLPMQCNYGKLKQRGLRCNCCKIVKEQKSVYLSAHCLGKAGDFSIVGMAAEAARERVKICADLFPCKVRVEGSVNWLHFDVLDMGEGYPKVYEFKA